MEASRQNTVAEHIQELRRRLMWSFLFVIAGALLGYFIHDYLIALLQQPLHDSLYYTTPGGAFSFVVKICTVFGLIVSLPMFIYQTFAYFGPLIKTKTKHSFSLYVVSSCLLAAFGILFAYWVSLPAALQFLVNFGEVGNIHALITTNEYFNFVLTYIAGFAALFQVPLLVVMIDKIKPMPPLQLFKGLRYVILLSFIAAAVITPTPDPINQAFMAGPIIALYLLSAVYITARSKFTKQRQGSAATRVSAAELQTKAHGGVARLSSVGIDMSSVPNERRSRRAVDNSKGVTASAAMKPRSSPGVAAMPRRRVISDFVTP